MDLVAITDRREIAASIDQLKATLNRGARKLQLEITTPGGGTYGNRVFVMWNDALKFWVYIDVEGGGAQYWCCYGILAPTEARKQGPVVQINPPIEGRNFHCQGAFARDAAGNVYYLHTGRLGGGHPGIGRESFVGSGIYGGHVADIKWLDGNTRSMYVIGKVDDESLLRTLAEYVHAVARIRSQHQPDRLEWQFPRIGGIFISHSSKDHLWCKDFVYHLKKGGVADIWYDADSLGAGGLNEQIQAAIASRLIFIVVLSPDAMASDYVHQEVDFALNLHAQEPQRTILPVMAATCHVPPSLDQFVRLRSSGDAGLSADRAAGDVLTLLTRGSRLRADSI